MAQSKASLIAVLLFTLVAGVGGSFAADAESQQATLVLSHDEFVKQRVFMLEDLDAKIKLMQEARACSEKAGSAVAFQVCNDVFVKGIRAHLQGQQSKSK